MDEYSQLFKWGPLGIYLDVTQLRFHDYPVPFLGKAEFTGVDGRTIDNFNFEVIGARHCDFSHVSNDEVNIATNLFMRELNKAATRGQDAWNDFVNKKGIRRISYDDDKKVWSYEVDPIEFKRSFE